MSEEYRDWQDEPVKVVRNHEGVCSIWPADRDNAAGWYDVGFSGEKAACLEYIKEHCDGDAKLKDFEPKPEELEYAKQKVDQISKKT